MKLSRAVLFAGAFALGAASASAQTIPAGADRWVTPANGQTYFVFPKGDLESLCGRPATGALYQAYFVGDPLAGNDWDTAVTRLDNATFNTAGVATTRIQVTALRFKSLNPVSTPCGVLTFKAELNGGQPISTMTITKTSAKGGTFTANIPVNVVIRAYNQSGAPVGQLFYSRNLPNPTTGAPWSFGPTGVFRPGISTTETCVAQLRQKLAGTSPTSSHYYFIENLIAQGRCTQTVLP
ncbi:MAG: hypothetical protein SF066_08485 [Thermoanaerobaculia bacterium]|nr:hypothetical protein [Thermoanaerobaculia bacterium]